MRRQKRRPQSRQTAAGRVTPLHLLMLLPHAQITWVQLQSLCSKHCRARATTRSSRQPLSAEAAQAAHLRSRAKQADRLSTHTMRDREPVDVCMIGAGEYTCGCGVIRAPGARCSTAGRSFSVVACWRPPHKAPWRASQLCADEPRCCCRQACWRGGAHLLRPAAPGQGWSSVQAASSQLHAQQQSRAAPSCRLPRATAARPQVRRMVLCDRCGSRMPAVRATMEAKIGKYRGLDLALECFPDDDVPDDPHAALKVGVRVHGCVAAGGRARGLALDSGCAVKPHVSARACSLPQRGGRTHARMHACRHLHPRMRRRLPHWQCCLPL